MEMDSRYRPGDRSHRSARNAATATKPSWRTTARTANVADSHRHRGAMDCAEMPSIYSYSVHPTPDNNPALVIRKILVLFDYCQFDEIARIIHTMPEMTLKSIAKELPLDMLIKGIPRTLQALDAIYARVFFSAGPQRFPFNLLQPESVVMQLIRLFAHYEETSNSAINWSHSDIAACKNILKIIAQVDPKLKKILFKRKRALDRALEGLGIHGMVLTADRNQMINLHDALKIEFKDAIKNYKTVLSKLDELELAHKKPKAKSISRGPAPVKSSHQRLMSLTQGEIHDRLHKNREVWVSVEPVLFSSRLPALLTTLNERIEADKEAIFQFSQLRKDTVNFGQNTVIAPILMQYARGFDRVLLLLKEVCDDSVSGYHSDSDSVVVPPSRTTTRSKQSEYLPL